MNSFGRHLRLSIFGESHGAGVGIILDGIPAGLTIDEASVQKSLDTRRPGTSSLVSARREADLAQILSGTLEGRATGAPLTIWIENRDVDSKPYQAMGLRPRPGHADFPAWVGSQGFADLRGGGHNSGRLTAPLVAAGSIAQAILDRRGIVCGAHVHAVAGEAGPPYAHSATTMLERSTRSPVATAHTELETKFMALIDAARADGDSVGGHIEFAAEGLPAGLGAPFFDSVEGQLAHLIFAVPAVKGVEFGSGFAGSALRGSENNDEYILEPDLDHPRVISNTNRAGGILGGRTTGAPLLGRVAIKPASSIAKAQATVDLATMSPATLEVGGRHDPCIAIRAVPAIRACVQLVLADFILEAGLGEPS